MASEWQRAEAAESRAQAAEKDAGRYRWLKNRRLAADFNYGEEQECCLVFTWPVGCTVSNNIDADIDAALAAQEEKATGKV